MKLNAERGEKSDRRKILWDRGVNKNAKSSRNQPGGVGVGGNNFLSSKSMSMCEGKKDVSGGRRENRQR